MKTNPRAARGFTLIEVLVVIVIAGIFAAIAIPNYTAYVTRSKRSAAKTALLDAANALERNYTTNGCYNRTTVANCQAQAGAAPAVPAVAPAEGTASYAVAPDFSGSATGQTYTLRATPCGTAGTCPAGSDSFTDAECQTLTLNQAGARGIEIGGTPSGDAALIARCWQR